jgi:hypothetical protein
MKENLEIDEGNVRVFRDMKYGFHFLHDIQEDLESEYECIRNKYSYRIGDKKANEEIVKQVMRVHRETVVVRFQDLGRMKYEKY